jgi:hypothetical protein
VSAISSDQIFCSHGSTLALGFDFGCHGEFCIPFLIDLDINQLGIALNAAFRVAKQICLQNPLNAALVNGDFVGESCRYGDVLDN